MTLAGHKAKIVRKAVQFHCWFCKAFPGEPCRNVHGTEYRNDNIHNARMRDAREHLYGSRRNSSK